MAAPVVLGVGPLSPALVAGLARYRLVRIDGTDDSDGRAMAGEVRAIVAGGSRRLASSWLAQFARLEAVVLHGVGTDGIDLAAMRARGVAVSTTPGVLDADVAELAIGLILGVGRGIVANDRFVREGCWRAGAAPPLGVRLSGRCVGLLGMGRIGQAIAQRLTGFGVSIDYTARHQRPALPYRWHENPVALARAADVLVVTVPGGAAARHLVDERVLDALGPGGILINVARGTAVDEDALIDALARGAIAGAGLDVFATEPQSAVRFAGLPNVILQPHQGSATVEARRAMADLVLRNLDSWFGARRLITPADGSPSSHAPAPSVADR